MTITIPHESGTNPSYSVTSNASALFDEVPYLPLTFMRWGWSLQEYTLREALGSTGWRSYLCAVGGNTFADLVRAERASPIITIPAEAGAQYVLTHRWAHVIEMMLYETMIRVSPYTGSNIRVVRKYPFPLFATGPGMALDGALRTLGLPQKSTSAEAMAQGQRLVNEVTALTTVDGVMLHAHLGNPDSDASGFARNAAEDAVFVHQVRDLTAPDHIGVAAAARYVGAGVSASEVVRYETGSEADRPTDAELSFLRALH